MNPSEVQNNSNSLFKDKRVLYALIVLFIISVIATILIFLTLINRDSNNQNSISNKNNQIQQNNSDNRNQQTQENQQNNQMSLLQTGICPDSLTFSPSSLAKLNGKDYLVSGDALTWIESNCPNTIKDNQNNTSSVNTLSWIYNGNTWISNGNVPTCSNPLEIMSPVDMTLVSAMLYPGQFRGGDYKPHGGFAFDNQQNNQVTVKLPDNAKLWRASRYIQDGEVQYLVDFISDCGVAYRFDHLLTLSSKLANIMNTLPSPNENTFTTMITPPVEFSKGEVIANEVGFRNTLNVGFDLGVYDLRSRNSISTNNANWAEMHKDEAEYAYYAICWLNNLAGQDKNIANSLPARGAEGNQSDYCMVQ